MNLLYSGSCSHLHPSFSDGTFQTIHDRLRIVRDGKHPPIRFFLQRDPTPLEPIHCIGRSPAIERPKQLSIASRIKVHQYGRIKASMSDIATSST
jgi:hypothetical protein